MLQCYFNMQSHDIVECTRKLPQSHDLLLGSMNQMTEQKNCPDALYKMINFWSHDKALNKLMLILSYTLDVYL
jgi:hypothetical protein